MSWYGAQMPEDTRKVFSTADFVRFLTEGTKTGVNASFVIIDPDGNRYGSLEMTSGLNRS